MLQQRPSEMSAARSACGAGGGWVLTCTVLGPRKARGNISLMGQVDNLWEPQDALGAFRLAPEWPESI